MFLLKTAAAAAMLLAGSDIAYAAPSYFCTADKASGFKWSGQEWQGANFRADEKYLVKPTLKENDRQLYQVSRMGKAGLPDFECSQDLWENGEPTSRIICGGLGKGFIMDVKTLRYQELYGIGYLDGKDVADHTPNLTIGRCSILDGD